MRFLLAEISIRIYITEFNEVLTYGQRKKIQPPSENPDLFTVWMQQIKR